MSNKQTEEDIDLHKTNVGMKCKATNEDTSEKRNDIRIKCFTFGE